MSQARENSPGRSTGPRTPDGKASSSKNAITHGCTSRVLLIEDEQEADWDALLAAWLAHYQPDTELFHSLVLHAAREQWFLLRNVRQYEQCEESLHKDHGSPLNWTEEHFKKRERFLRYKAAAERSFYRARNAADQMRKPDSTSRARTQPEPQPASLPTRDLLAELEKARKEGEQHPMIVQHIEVRILDGQTVTDLYPPNSELLEQIHAHNAHKPPIESVRRLMNFPEGFPPEYQWARTIGDWISDGREQMLTIAEWLETAEREKQSGTGHLAPPLDATVEV